MRSFAFSALRPAHWLSAGVMALCLTACPNKDYPACKKDKHCKVDEGEKCVDNICQNCVTDDDCVGQTGENGEALTVCYEHRCSDPAAIGQTGQPGELNSPCTTTDECSGGLVCKEGKCDVCSSDDECGGSACNFDTGRCDTGGAIGGGSCTTDDECAMDEICDGGMCVFSGDVGNEGEVLCDLQAVYFDFDSPTLKPETQEALQNAAQCIAEQGREVILEAHADPRGTEEYNILLTDRRGQGVKSFLENLGVPGESMSVVSKGSLEASGTDAGSWSQDRRVEFIWK